MSGTDTIERGRIAEAYESLAEKPGAFISIRALREATVGRVADLDGTLRRMYADGWVNLVPQSNQAALAEADRAAGIVCGGEVKHRLSWED